MGIWSALGIDGWRREHYRITSCRQAYTEGRAARKSNPNATTWEGVLPYSYPPLTRAWLDGWNDEAGQYCLTLKNGPKVPWAYYFDRVGGVCPYCWSINVTDLPDGTLRCGQYPCREQNYPPVDHERARVFLARRDAGSYI